MSYWAKQTLLKCIYHGRLSQIRNLELTRVINHNFETMAQVREKLRKFLGQDKVFSPGADEVKPNRALANKLPKSQSEIPVRAMKDSYDVAIIPLSSDLALKDKYISNLGHIRLGRIMEDLDMFAGYCSFLHCLFPSIPENTAPPIAIVTISVSQIEILRQIQPDIDVRISGNVCWVGTSSLEVVVWLHQEKNGELVEILRALFLMAARNAYTGGAAVVNAVRGETEMEIELLKGGEERKLRRQQMMKESLLNTVPTEEELHVVHSLFIKTIDPKGAFLDHRILPPHSKWMKDAALSTLVFCHPEYRNLHNKVFGGFLMRKALELSWIIGFLHGVRVPKLFGISDIGFYSPVDVGAIVKMTGTVTYTENEFVHIFVKAEAFSITNPGGTNSTVFSFTYDMGKPVDAVFPMTYLEAMKYLDGRRRFKKFITTTRKE